jgi:hypothetical protein
MQGQSTRKNRFLPQGLAWINMQRWTGSIRDLAHPYTLEMKKLYTAPNADQDDGFPSFVAMKRLKKKKMENRDALLLPDRASQGGWEKSWAIFSADRGQ